MFIDSEIGTLVIIKVMYEGKMKSIWVRIIGGEVNHTIQQLKEKIVSYFGLTVGADDLDLTYIDEDGDVVGLVDSDDLHDMVEQGINPITVIVDIPSQKTASNKSLWETVATVWNYFMELLVQYKKLWFPFREQPKAEAKVQLNKCKTSDYITCGVSDLESCLIGDVNVLNKPMAPSTPFTKIWRMKNNGMVAWPQETELICIGGDELSHQLSFKLEIPEGGVPVDEEFNIGVNLVCPKIPGEYIAFWRLRSPTGEMFGQRIKVIIEVEDTV